MAHTAGLTEEDLQKSAAFSDPEISEKALSANRRSTYAPSHDEDENMVDGMDTCPSAEDDNIDHVDGLDQDLPDCNGTSSTGGDYYKGDPHRLARNSSRARGDDSPDTTEDAEGVGAVKLQPGESESDDQDDDSHSSNESESIHDENSGSSEEWELDEHLSEHEGEEDDDDGESPSPNNCIYCGEGEKEGAQPVNSCTSCFLCHRNAHLKCIPDADMKPGRSGKINAGNWKCSDCRASKQSTPYHDSSKPGHDTASETPSNGLDTQLSIETASPRNDGTASGSARSLRKRTMTAAEEDETASTFRKRLRQNPTLSRRSLDNIDKDTKKRQSKRSLRIKKQRHVAVTRKGPTSLLVVMHVKPSALNQILTQTSGGPSGARRGTRRTMSFVAPSTATQQPVAPFAYISQPFYSFFDRETDEVKGKPYGGVLTEAEADTSKTLPAEEDRKRFVEAQETAEAEWRNRILQLQPDINASVKKPKKARAPGSQIECIDFGGWEIDTWYAASYPEEYSCNRVLYICEFCLKYMNSDYVAWRHKLKCPAKHPPGDEIYRFESISVFEVDGRKHPVYCQNLCLLAKLFLGSKTLYYDVEPFLFYILCEYDELGYHFVGYFSKEKRASSQNNVSCILTLPIHQRKGYGNLLIDFSYLLTRVEQKTGSPEKPLSDMGLVSYRNYWRLVLCQFFLDNHGPDNKPKSGMSIRHISDSTGLTPDDVVSALEGLRCLVRDPESQLYALRVDLDYCRAYVAKWEAKNYVKLKPSALTWTPYVMGRGVVNTLDMVPGLSHIDGSHDGDDELDNQTGPSALHCDMNINDGDLSHGQSPTESHCMDHGDTQQEPTNLCIPMDVDQPYPSTESLLASSIANSQSTGPREDDDSMDWEAAYNDIPPTRFRVFPATTSRRPEVAKVAVMATSSEDTGIHRTNKTTPKQASSVVAQSNSISLPRAPSSSSHKRKGESTGRGPGRWPKGTKKADYGNAESGPGMPPGWRSSPRIAEQARNNLELAVSNGPNPNTETNLSV
ncbi:hypothetical protein BROUX41_002707 [Berkeleyomyces rouxiae]|uniref:uncharacterized protein n=1 Tax=Berkeleyomyces rouxiae TaxID=2035830 RepID=UPI003B7A11EC